MPPYPPPTNLGGEKKKKKEKKKKREEEEERTRRGYRIAHKINNHVRDKPSLRYDIRDKSTGHASVATLRNVPLCILAI